MLAEWKELVPDDLLSKPKSEDRATPEKGAGRLA